MSVERHVYEIAQRLQREVLQLKMSGIDEPLTGDIHPNILALVRQIVWNVENESEATDD